jgi:RimJ/RimL family protein N-acetyltransferase
MSKFSFNIPNLTDALREKQALISRINNKLTVKLIKLSNIDHLYVLQLKENPPGENIIGYLSGQCLVLRDGRRAFWIREFQSLNIDIGAKLFEYVLKNVFNQRADCVIVYIDTDNIAMMNFYSKYGFMLDIILRQNSRRDIFSVHAVIP